MKEVGALRFGVRKSVHTPGITQKEEPRRAPTASSFLSGPTAHPAVDDRRGVAGRRRSVRVLPDRRFLTKQLRHCWNDAVARVGIEDFKMGDSRHLAAQFAGDEGMTDRDLAIYLGHTNPTMSHRYSRTPTARKVAKAVADRLLA